MKHDPSGSSGSKVNYSSHGSTTSQWESVSRATLLDKNHCFPFSSEAKELLGKKGTENKEFLSAPPSCSVAAKECRRPGLSELHLQRGELPRSPRLNWYDGIPLQHEGWENKKWLTKEQRFFQIEKCSLLPPRLKATDVRSSHLSETLGKATPGFPNKTYKNSRRNSGICAWTSLSELSHLSTLSSIPDSWADSEPKFASAINSHERWLISSHKASETWCSSHKAIDIKQSDKLKTHSPAKTRKTCPKKSFRQNYIISKTRWW